jgi:hypothetical protein
MTEKNKSEMKALLESFGSVGNEVSDMLSSVTQLFLDSIRQVNGFDQRVRAFSFFAINFKKFLMSSHGGTSGFVGGIYWQFNVDSMAEQCRLLDDEHSIVISQHKEDGREGSVVRIVDRTYDAEKVMDSMVVEMRKSVMSNEAGSSEIDYPSEMPES